MSPGDDKHTRDEGGVLRAGPFQGGMACATPERHVWWDLYTPTDAVATLLADWSWSSPPTAMTTTNICTPVSLQQLVAAHGLT
ncbi:hypothetical protein HU200_066578 [Digitaria exilis]|uniref:Uncharacterized protein n=1 Tax=Digitaria exilis TaxID=1010633 RepID=A0A834ZXW9_9POAL|nr:hypothetical protein HU200_066578 [Digitaria exilis]